MRIAIGFVLLVAVVAPSAEPDGSLPSAGELKARTLASMRKAQLALERYSCSVHGFYDELDDDGNVRKHLPRRSDRFYVNGVQIDHVISRNGKDLTGADAKKEQARVDSEVRKYSDRAVADKKQDQREQTAQMFIRAQRFTNGHRESRWGYNTIAFDLSGDPDFRPRNLQERLAQAMSGRIWIDEESGVPVELQIRTDHDVKIGGGLLATLHKGFELKIVEHRQADGTWLEQSAEGSGDARAALFFHPRFRFMEQVGSCRLFTVESRDTTHDQL